MPFFGGSWSQDENGYIDYSGGTLNSWLGGSNEDEQRYAIEFNTALDQYNQQYALQKDSFQFQKDQAAIQNQLARDTFNLNKENLQFNQNLANRQQALSEESYYNGVLNQASQMSKLGINPASSGGSISGPTMSGGSNVSGMPGASAGGAGSVGSPQSARAVAQSKYAAKKSMQMQLMASLMSFAQKKKELSIAQQNADTNTYNAETSRISAEAQAGVSNATADQIMESLKFFKDNGHFPGQGYGSTESATNRKNILDLLGLVIFANSLRHGNDKFGGKGNPKGSPPSGGSPASSGSSARSWSMDAPTARRPVREPVATMPAPGSVWSPSVDQLESLGIDLPKEITYKVSKGKSIDWAELSKAISEALDKMNSSQVAIATTWLARWGMPVPVF